MEKLPNSQLIVNDKGAIYHLNLRPQDIADTVIIVGDPGRVSMISAYFDRIDFQGQNREIVTHTGWIGNKHLSVMSTGMGPDNIDIVLNELDALVNIDLRNKLKKETHQVLNIIRLGTSGAIQQEIPVDSYVMSKYGLGMDGLLNFYQPENSVFETKMEEELIKQTDWPVEWARPYIVKSSEHLAEKVGFDMLQGITITAPGFYGPQGRQLRMKLNHPEFYRKIEDVNLDGEKILNFEMETSALYGLGKSLGHNVLTICAIIANRRVEEYSTDHHTPMKKLIEILLDRLINL